MKKISIYVLVILVIVLISCQTTVNDIPPNLSPAEFFQKAQDASENGNYTLSMEYYRTFQKRFPDNFEKNLWASYEIAFLYHKMGKDKTAIKLFNELLNKYATQGEKDWPEAPKILAQKVRDELIKKENKKK
ncbi:MAG: tetratricopeptide repeat protein [Spirochaetales bacterium]|nr:tetratricopeptide repeat protein [Spirochaetales bacterium]